MGKIANKTAKKKTAKRKTARADIPAALMATGKRLGAAFKTHDTATVRKLTHPRYSHVDIDGQYHDKPEVLRNLDTLVSGGRETSTKITSFGRVAMITGLNQSAGKPDVLSLHIWVKDKPGWQLLISHNNVIAPRGASKPHHAPVPRPADAPPPDCRNPLVTIPFKPKSPAERAVIKAFQTMEKAVVHNDPKEWVKWVADGFVVYRTGQHPTTKAGRVAHITAQRKVNAETWIAEIRWMELRVYGNATVMHADHVMPGNRRPPYRATRIWVKRGGRWQMAVSQQTTIAELSGRP